MVEFLFLDLDNTILDFGKAERIALATTLESFGLEMTEAVCERYRCINRDFWERLERRELTRQQVLVGRFEALFRELGVEADAALAEKRYAESHVTQGHYFLPGAQEALIRLSGKYKLYLATNGTAQVQQAKLASSGIARYFQDIFISQDIGADKPSPEYFSRCFARIAGFDPDRAMIVGDSLTSDIQGGIQTGMATCWVNPEGTPGRADIRPDYEIQSLTQLEALLDAI